MPVPKKVSKMTLAELEAERASLKPAIKKMKRNPGNHSTELSEKSRRNLHLKDEISRRKKVVETPVDEVSPTEEAPAMLMAA